MKIASKLIAFAATLLMLASCGEKTGTDVDHSSAQRDIYYTVADNSGFNGLSGNTVHLDTETEWDALLETFCNHARSGENVTFCSTHTGQPKAKDASNTTPTSITTTNRDELKTWMKEMEKAGKTVNITYDDNTGTWNGRAYANISNHDSYGEPQNYTGTIVFVPVPELDNPPLDGVAMALQVDDDETYIVTVYGMIIRFDTVVDHDFIRILQDSPATIEGIGGTHTDLNGSTFLSLDMVVPESGVIEF